MKLNTDEALMYRDSLVVKARESGQTQTQIAAAYGIHQSTVSRILRMYEANGRQLPLPRRTTASAKRALSDADEELLKQILARGARSEGFDTEGWDRGRVRDVIRKHFGVEYHISHLSKVLRRLGYTLQRPKRKDYRQDATKKKQWLEQTLPALKKSN